MHHHPSTYIPLDLIVGRSSILHEDGVAIAQSIAGWAWHIGLINHMYCFCPQPYLVLQRSLHPWRWYCVGNALALRYQLQCVHGSVRTWISRITEFADHPATTPGLLMIAAGASCLLAPDVGMLTFLWCLSRNQWLRAGSIKIPKTPHTLPQSPIQTCLILSTYKPCVVRYSVSAGR